MNQPEMAKELASLIRAVKTKFEIEKRFGVTSFASSKPVASAQPPIPDTNETKPDAPAAQRPVDAQTSVQVKGDKSQLLEKLKQEALACHKCPLDKTRTNLVFGVGNPSAGLMFVGEAPGRDEDLQGEPFVGRAGQLLTKIIEAIGMKRGDVYIANVLKCRPPGNRNPLPDEIALCMPYLLKQIEIIQPKALCALGTFAAQTLLNTKAPVGTLRGRFHQYKNIPMMVTFHPAYLLRNPNDKAKVWEDMKKVRDFLHEGKA